MIRVVTFRTSAFRGKGVYRGQCGAALLSYNIAELKPCQMTIRMSFLGNGRSSPM